jgi:hypothetical protein
MPNLWCFLFLFVKIASCQDLTSLLITQPWEYELTYVERFEKTAKNEVVSDMDGLFNGVAQKNRVFCSFFKWKVFSVF